MLKKTQRLLDQQNAPAKPLMAQAKSHKLRPAAMLVLGSLFLVGCQTNKHEITGSVQDDYRQRHPITLEQSAQMIDIPVGANSEGLTPASRSAIVGFARDFNRENAAVIQVMVPAGTDNESSASFMARKIRTVLLQQGVSASRIDIFPYTAPMDGNPPIKLAYPRVEAKTLACGSYPAALAGNYENFSYFDFGCSTQANLAASVANPEDLIQPRGWSARDSGRRSEVYEKYRKGEQTSSESLSDDSGTSSSVQ